MLWSGWRGTLEWLKVTANTRDKSDKISLFLFLFLFYFLSFVFAFLYALVLIVHYGIGAELVICSQSIPHVPNWHRPIGYGWRNLILRDGSF